jgi:hypothetical protein
MELPIYDMGITTIETGVINRSTQVNDIGKGIAAKAA